MSYPKLVVHRIVVAGALWILGLPASWISYAQVPNQPPSSRSLTWNDPSLANQQLQPYFLRSRRFNLPIQLAQAAHRITAIQLYVSTDAGRSWQLYAQQPPATPEFAFQAPHDGHYWFASKTVDEMGVAHPEGPPRAEQWVVVDTSQPILRLTYEQGRTGEVMLWWQISDEALDPSTFKLDYREGILSAWQPLLDVSAVSQIATSGGAGGRMTATGQYAWRPKVQSRVLEVRLSAGDRAGNVNTEIQRVFLPRSAHAANLSQPPASSAAAVTPPPGVVVPSTPGGATVPAGTPPPAIAGSFGSNPPSPAQTSSPGSPPRVDDRTPPIATTPVAPTARSDSLWPGSNQLVPSSGPNDQHNATASGAPSVDPSLSHLSQTAVSSPPNANSSERASVDSQPPPSGGAPLAATDHRPVPVGSQTATGENLTQPNRTNLSSAPPREPRSGLPCDGTDNPPAGGQIVINPFYQGQPSPQAVARGQDNAPHGASASAGAGSVSSYPPLANQSEARSDLTPATSGDGPTPWPEVPPGQALRMTRSRRFQLEYDLEAAVAETIKEVQLWGTRDMAQTWEKWGIDPDRQSPFDVEVDRDGIYGFRVVLLAANGLATEIPRSGAPADLWVGVDGNPPLAEITAIEFGTGTRAGQLQIRWRARDERLGPQPVCLSFSERPDGPWTTISAGIANSGQYFWLVDSNVPRAVFVRLEVQDEAGNRTAHVIPQPINLQGLIPRARIRNIKSGDGSAQR